MRIEVLKYERIRNIRIDNDLKQREVAEFLNISQNTYSQYEIGVRNFPLDTIIRLAQFYNTSVDYLVGLTDDPRPYPKKK